MKTLFATILLAGATAVSTIDANAADRDRHRGGDKDRGSVSVKVEDGKVTGVNVRYTETNYRGGHDRDRDRHDRDRYDRDRHDRGHHHGHNHRLRDAEKIRYRGRTYAFDDGKFYTLDRRGWSQTRAPEGITVRRLPRRADHQHVRGRHYEVYAGVWYQKSRWGYTVVDEPRRHGHGHDRWDRDRDHRGHGHDNDRRGGKGIFSWKR